MPRGGMWPAERTKSSVEVGGDLNVAALEKARSDDRNRELGFTSLHPNSFASSPVTFEGSGLSCIFREIFQKFRVRKLVNYFAKNFGSLETLFSSILRNLNYLIIDLSNISRAARAIFQ